jgi:hypothetical protein
MPAPSEHRLSWVGLGALFLGGCASAASIARDEFVAKYACSADHAVAEDDGVGHARVAGCGKSARYVCARDTEPCRKDPSGCYTSGLKCSEAGRSAYQATDGSLHAAWVDGASGFVSLMREATVVSAAHDLPCAPASVAVVARLTAEGCGQRVTYKEAPQTMVTPPGEAWIQNGLRLVLVGRVPLAAPEKPSSSATPPAPAPVAP